MSSARDALVRSAAAYARPSPSGWYRGNCPFCEAKTGKADHKQSWSILMSEGAYHCFRCGSSGRVRDWNGKEEGFDETTIVAPSIKELQAPEGFYTLSEEPALSSESAEPARKYLRGRGLTDEAVWADAKLGVCLSGKQAGRVIVPVLSADDEWVGWVGRVWEKKTSALTYVYPPGMRRGEVLYSQGILLVPSDKPVLIVEGVFDSLAFWGDSAALLGKPSGSQMDALVASKRPIAVVLDGDAWRDAEALAMSLRIEGQRAGCVRLPAGKDPDEMNKSWLWDQAYKCLDDLEDA